jgi:serine/threonine-protein kinase
MSLAEEVAAAAAATAAKGNAPARAAEASSPMSLVAEMTAPGSAEASRRGLDDTHPSYKVKSDSPDIYDTQPGVVIDEEALANMETEESAQPIVGGLLEEPPSAPARLKSGRRPRVSAPGTPPTGRQAASGRSGVVRALDAEESSEPESSEPNVVSGEADVDVDLDLDTDPPTPRDPRDDTRRTPIPTRPGEPGRRTQREDARRASPAAPAQKKRSWWGLVLTVVLLGVVGGALAMTYPTLKPILDKFLSTPTVKPPPPVPLAPPPAEPEGSASPVPAEAAPSAPAATGEAAPGQPATEPAAVAAAEPVPEDTDILVPLTAPPTAKKQSVRTTRKGSRKENDLQKEWGQTSRAFIKLTEVQSCESPKVGILCKRFESLQNDVDQAGDSGDRELLGRVRRLRSDLQKAMNAAQ